MNTSKILKFGTITELENGDLAITGFRFDCAQSTGAPEILLLKAVIERLQRSLDESIQFSGPNTYSFRMPEGYCLTIEAENLEMAQKKLDAILNIYEADSVK